MWQQHFKGTACGIVKSLLHAGYRVTCVGGSEDQTVVVMSLERGSSGLSSTQETLRTSEFPVKHVKEKWGKDLYLDCMAFGRTTT